MAERMPAAEFDIDTALVGALLREQCPTFADRAVTALPAGWDCAIFRVGDRHVARLPRRSIVAPLMVQEQRWLPGLASSLPLAVPAAVHAGRPGCGYPWAWSVCPWFDGDIATRTPPSDAGATAESIGAFLAALHVPAPPDAPRNPYRGVPLAARAEPFDTALTKMTGHVDERTVRSWWSDAVAVPPWTGPPVWLHGDLHPANIVVQRGRVSAVIDWIDLAAGDPATDYAVAWMLFDNGGDRERLRIAARGVDDATWQRGRGWALYFAIVILANSADNPTMAAIGERTLARVLGPQ